MRIKWDLLTGEPDLPVLITLTLLAELSGVSRYTMQRVLHQAGVHCVRVGRRRLIPMTEIETKTPVLHENLPLLAARLRARKERKSR